MGEGIHLYGDRAPHNEEFVVLTASSNLTEERVLTGTANQITITDNGAGGTVVLSIPSGLIIPGTITIPNTGLHILDTGGDHDLIIAPGSDLSADRTLTLTTGDAARTITLSGNPTLNDWFDQSVKVAASPTFADVFVPDGGTFGISGNELLTFNAAGTAVFSGCNVGIGVVPGRPLEVSATAGASVAIAAFFTPAMANGNQCYFALGQDATAGFYFMYEDNATAASRYLAIQSQLYAPGAQSIILLNGGNVGVGGTPTSKLDVFGAISSNTLDLSAAGPTDNLDVSGVNTVFIDTSGNNVTLGGTVGGVDGQVLSIVVHDATNNFTIEHNEGTGNQDFILHAGADETMTAEYGGWVFVNDGGTHWHDASHAKHV